MNIVTLSDHYERITGLSADLRSVSLTPRLDNGVVHRGAIFENHGDPSCSEVNIAFSLLA